MVGRRERTGRAVHTFQQHATAGMVTERLLRILLAAAVKENGTSNGESFTPCLALCGARSNVQSVTACTLSDTAHRTAARSMCSYAPPPPPHSIPRKTACAAVPCTLTALRPSPPALPSALRTATRSAQSYVNSY